MVAGKPVARELRNMVDDDRKFRMFRRIREVAITGIPGGKVIAGDREWRYNGDASGHKWRGWTKSSVLDGDNGERKSAMRNKGEGPVGGSLDVIASEKLKDFRDPKREIITWEQKGQRKRSCCPEISQQNEESAQKAPMPNWKTGLGGI